MVSSAAASPLPPSTDRILTGVGLMVFFCIVAPLIDVASKIAVQTVSTGTVTLSRFLVQGLMMAAIVVAKGLPLRLGPRAAALTVVRALAAIGSTFCFIAALRVMPIADALAINFVAPFMLLMLGRFVLKEQVGPRRTAAAFVGFLGTLLVIQPSFAVFGANALLPLASAACFAVYMLVTRRLSRDLHPMTMQLHTAIAASVGCLPILLVGTLADVGPIRFVLPEGEVWLWCLAVGVTATISHMAMTYALFFAPSSVLAPLAYLEIVTATLFGYLVFNDFPGGMTWTGIAVIVASGLYVVHRERVVARDARRAAAPAVVG